MIGGLESRMVEALESIAAGIERLASLEERDEIRRAVRGLLKLCAKYSEEPETPPLRVVR